jgi:hypothetical protein
MCDCYSRHVETSRGQFHHVFALGALLPLAAFGDVHEELHMRIAGAEALVVSGAFAAHTGLLFAENTRSGLGLDVLGTNELGALGVGAIRRVWRGELFYFEIEVLD